MIKVQKTVACHESQQTLQDYCDGDADVLMNHNDKSCDESSGRWIIIKIMITLMNYDGYHDVC